MSSLHNYVQGEFGHGASNRMEKAGLQVFAEGIYGAGFSNGIGQSIPKGGSGVPECSLTTPRGLHIFGPGDSKERPGWNGG